MWETKMSEQSIRLVRLDLWAISLQKNKQTKGVH